MKDDWRRYLTRKDRLERISEKCSGLSDLQAVVAWRDLVMKLWNMADPAAPKVPKFNDLLLGILSASVHGKMKAK